MNCNDARAAYLSGEATGEHRDHLSTCRLCMSLGDELHQTRGVLDDAALWQRSGAGLEDRVVALISGSAASGRSRKSGRWRWAVAAGITAAILGGAVVASMREPAPDWELAIPGTAEAAGASGTVLGWNEDRGTRLRFELTGLDPAPEGTVYEVWFSSDTLHVSAGTFRAGGTIDMSTGIARKDFPRIWITVEPIDTDLGPSGRTVLDTG